MTAIKTDFTVPQNGVTLYGTTDAMGAGAKISSARAEQAKDFLNVLNQSAGEDTDGFVTTSDSLFQFAKNGINKLAADINFDAHLRGDDMNTAGQQIINTARHAINNVAYSGSGSIKITTAFSALGDLKNMLDRTNINENGADDIARRMAAAGVEGTAASEVKSSATAVTGKPVDLAAAAALPVVQMKLQQAANATSLSGKAEGLNAALAELKAGLAGKATSVDTSAVAQGVIGAEPLLDFGTKVIGNVTELVAASRANVNSQAVPSEVSTVERKASSLADLLASVLSVRGEGAQSVTTGEFGSFVDTLSAFNKSVGKAYEGVGGEEERLANTVLDSTSNWVSSLSSGSTAA